ncbi:MAG: response regulator transcription factor [Spirochaetales bacterium]|nr:response regulator transcription factor [Leptospiraceae bacterium]MCP5483416.1 response regulator transcription factor [Spirochaetales bacterium]MCP5486777.1 response regulator transcription factor [Spirochaetales bacterium]
MDTNILLVDDDRKLRELLSEFLSNHGFRVHCLADGNGILSALQEYQANLVILDIMLPGGDGFEVLKEIRARSDVPVIMLTARGEPIDRVLGLELGADDYLAKPFEPRELLARLKAILRRTRHSEPVAPAGPVRIRVGELELDQRNQRLTVGSEVRELSGAESELLAVLLAEPDRVFSRDEIMNQTRGRDYMGFERTIDVHISRLRNVLSDFPGYRDRIRTVRGRGYMFTSAD